MANIHFIVKGANEDAIDLVLIQTFLLYYVNLFSITGIIVMISGIAFDHFSRLRAFPYDRFKVYRIVTIVRIELNSNQAIEVVSVVWVAFPYDRCDRMNI